jgi:hypothetical protein
MLDAGHHWRRSLSHRLLDAMLKSCRKDVCDVCEAGHTGLKDRQQHRQFFWTGVMRRCMTAAMTGNRGSE